MQDDVVILEGARTPMAEWVGGKTGAGKRGGALASLSVVDLGSLATKEALRRAGVAQEEVDHLMLGNAVQTSSNPIYAARHVALDAGC